MKSLKIVLLVNALSSGATGLLLILFSPAVADLFGAKQQWPFVAAGIFLLLFSVLVFMQSRKDYPTKGWLKLIIALDVLWVIESAVVIFPRMFGLTVIGYILIGGVAAWVALMAFLQMKGLRRLSFQG
jgi:hypothetical protein